MSAVVIPIAPPRIAVSMMARAIADGVGRFVRPN
jgi:hypothetical protein